MSRGAGVQVYRLVIWGDGCKAVEEAFCFVFFGFVLSGCWTCWHN